MQQYCKYYIFVPFMNMKMNWDGLGIAASLACAIHCAVLPLLVTSLPLFGVNIIHNTYFEWGMIGLAFVIGAYSLFHGFLKHHRSVLPIGLFAAGFMLLVIKQYFPGKEVAILVPAVLLIVSAHLINYRFCQQSKCASPHHMH